MEILSLNINSEKNNNIKIYNDIYASKLISDYEYNKISETMKNGINFFNSNYKGYNPLEWIVNNNLAPSVLARSAFSVNKQLKVFELDKKEMIEDKLNRINKDKLNTTNITYVKTNFNCNWINDLSNSSYNTREKTFCSMIGISHYLDKDIFKNTIKELSNIIPKGSSILFDYPNTNKTEKEITNKKLASGANEEMKSLYSYNDIKRIAEESNMLIYEHLNYETIDNTYFYDYNMLKPNEKINAPMSVSYAILIKQ